MTPWRYSCFLWPAWRALGDPQDAPEAFEDRILHIGDVWRCFSTDLSWPGHRSNKNWMLRFRGCATDQTVRRCLAPWTFCNEHYQLETAIVTPQLQLARAFIEVMTVAGAEQAYALFESATTS